MDKYRDPTEIVMHCKELITNFTCNKLPLNYSNIYINKYAVHLATPIKLHLAHLGKVIYWKYENM